MVNRVIELYSLASLAAERIVARCSDYMLVVAVEVAAVVVQNSMRGGIEEAGWFYYFEILVLVKRWSSWCCSQSIAECYCSRYLRPFDCYWCSC